VNNSQIKKLVWLNDKTGLIDDIPASIQASSSSTLLTKEDIEKILLQI
jgi:hypothetical protein